LVLDLLLRFCQLHARSLLSVFYLFKLLFELAQPLLMVDYLALTDV